MISALELRHIIEGGFLPSACICTLNPDRSLQIRIFEPVMGRIELLVTGIASAKLTTSRAIANLIAELKSEMEGIHRLHQEAVDAK
ncbi:DUF1652 domain-containing protein [Pseudomonas sp. 18058]|uniref:DUF1652 domain-containing protein n=1 Tax=Pseudomonas sp. 18058 TaxID=2681406 RepID=UPI00135BA57F|nr:DUF1652 domain-containing protein [Pseudomonas sp. 18058]